MSPATMRRLLRWSCVLTLVGLGLCLWSLIDPDPIPVILAMSLAQAIGTAAFAIYLVVLFFDLRLSRRLEAVPRDEKRRTPGDDR